ncbi:DUF4368 domain-containing protein [uncultured Oscillibacter sp.]|uniref:DUF4368 domain-containing protein n=2 Tax=uncultured Oscillibacter sp. TaxID=876091 RepID=UPI00351DBAAF
MDTAAEREVDMKRFIALVHRYLKISERTYGNDHEFIGRMLVHKLGSGIAKGDCQGVENSI